ncbi:hypothetical protein L3X38_037072 [Prunus dulcis]|uniref:Uncharacterized protein n=1 Tax=Prunus dulcis TaxID=3755 RepID=A0AAD4YQB0_PRUDU|nr:hypothetical protein L3X38_037072 [Prunus dulcis]
MLVLVTIVDENSQIKCSNSLTNGLVNSKDSQDKCEKKEGTRGQQRKFSSYKKDEHEQPASFFAALAQLFLAQFFTSQYKTKEHVLYCTIAYGKDDNVDIEVDEVTFCSDQTHHIC